MSHGEQRGNTAHELFDREEVEGVLNGSFYTAPTSETRPKSTENADGSAVSVKGNGKAKPTHYKVICISMYTDALGRLDEMVAELKRRGYTKANRSALIRHALNCVDLDEVPKGI